MVKFGKIFIPQILPEVRKPFIDLVNQILEITSAQNYDSKNPPSEQKNLEKEIEIKDGKDFLIDWDILPNRSSDCLCYMGIVKEIIRNS